MCRRTKRNPALVGPAGSGKTAIVEGLAQRVVSGRRPACLWRADDRPVALELVAGAGVVGELQTRMKAMLAEAARTASSCSSTRCTRSSGQVGGRASDDVGGLIKPALARGDLACIGGDDRRRVPAIHRARRGARAALQPVRVQEMSAGPDEARVVIQPHREVLSRLRGVGGQRRSSCAGCWISPQQYLRNRSSPTRRSIWWSSAWPTRDRGEDQRR